MRKALGLSLAAIAALGLGSHRLRRDAEAAFPEQKPPSKLSWKTKDLPDYLSTDWKRKLDGELVPWDWPIQRYMLESWGPFFSNNNKRGAMFTTKIEFNEELENYLKNPLEPKQWTKLEMGFHPKNAGMSPSNMLTNRLRDANIAKKHESAWDVHSGMGNFPVNSGEFRPLGFPVPKIVGLYEDNKMTYYLLKWDKTPVNKRDAGGTIYSNYVFKDLYSMVGVREDEEGNEIAEIIGSLTLQKKDNTEALRKWLELNYIPEFRYDYSDLLKKQQGVILPSFVVKETHKADMGLAGSVKQTKFWYMREGKPPIAFFLERDHKSYITKSLGGYGEISWVRKILRNQQIYLGRTRTGTIQVIEGKRKKIVGSQPCPLEDIENEEQMWLNRLVLSIMVDDFNLSDRRINAFNKDKEAWWATQDNVFREGVESGLLIFRKKPLEHLYDEFLKGNHFTRSKKNQTYSRTFLDSLDEKMLALNYVNKNISDEAKKYLSDNTKPNKFYWRPFLLTSVIALDRYANIIQSGIPSLPNVNFETYLKKRLKSASASNPKEERMMMFPYNLFSFEFETLVGLKVNGEYLGLKALRKIHNNGEVCSNQDSFSPHEKLFEDPEWRLLQKRLNAWNPLDNGPKN